MTEERTGEAFELGEQLTVIGRKLRAGEQAPEFELERFDGQTFSTVRLSEGAGRVRMVATVNSVDTPVCDVEARRLSELELPAGIDLYTVSMDLPFAQARWSTATGMDGVLLTSHKDESFGRAYGVLIKEWRLLQRAVFVIDGDGTLVHAEYVDDQMAEPDYDAALDAVRSALAR